MNATGTITMTMRELDRFKIIHDVADGTLESRHPAPKPKSTKSPRGARERPR